MWYPGRIGRRFAEQGDPVIERALGIAVLLFLDAEEIARPRIGAILGLGLGKGFGGGRRHGAIGDLHQRFTIGRLKAGAIGLQRHRLAIGTGRIVEALHLEIGPAEHAPAFGVIGIGGDLFLEARDQRGDFAGALGLGTRCRRWGCRCGQWYRCAGKAGLAHGGIKRATGKGDKGCQPDRQTRQRARRQRHPGFLGDMPGSEHAALDLDPQTFGIGGRDGAGRELHIDIGELITQHRQRRGAGIGAGFMAAHQRNCQHGGDNRHHERENDPEGHRGFLRKIGCWRLMPRRYCLYRSRGFVLR